MVAIKKNTFSKTQERMILFEMESDTLNLGGKPQVYDPPGTEYGSEIVAAGLIITLFICTLTFIFITLRRMVTSTPSPAISILHWHRQQIHKLPRISKILNSSIFEWLYRKRKERWRVAMLTQKAALVKVRERIIFKGVEILSRVWEGYMWM